MFMMMKRSDFEIMAPVGSYDSLTAAIQGGADSVYFGIEGLNMRARSSNNFTIDDLHEIVRICNEHHKELSDGQYRYLRRRYTSVTSYYRCGEGGRALGYYRQRCGGYDLCPRDRGRGAFVDPAEYIQYRGVAILCPFCRCGGAGPGVEYGTGSPYS